METIIFPLLSCLYLYDSGMLGPVCIRKQMLYIVFLRLYTVPQVYRLLARAVTYRADGIPHSGGIGKFAQSVYWLLASKGLNKQMCYLIHRDAFEFNDGASHLIGTLAQAAVLFDHTPDVEIMHIDVLTISSCTTITETSVTLSAFKWTELTIWLPNKFGWNCHFAPNKFFRFSPLTPNKIFGFSLLAPNKIWPSTFPPTTDRMILFSEKSIGPM